jgi:hypothetical protein
MVIIQLLLRSEYKNSTKSIPSIMPRNEEVHSSMLVESRCDIQARYHQLGFSLEACIEVIPYNTKSDLSIRLIHVDCRERDRAPTLVQRRSKNV